MLTDVSGQKQNEKEKKIKKQREKRGKESSKKRKKRRNNEKKYIAKQGKTCENKGEQGKTGGNV